MKRFVVSVLLALFGMTTFAADELGIENPKALVVSIDDCKQVVDYGTQIVNLRDRGLDQQTVTAVLVRGTLMESEKYRATLPLLLSFTHESFRAGKTLTRADLVETLKNVCLQHATGTWVYF